MENKEIVEGKIGTVGEYDLEWKEGKLVFVLRAKDPLGISSAGLEISLSAEAVLDSLAKAIPGTIDDAIFGLIKAALLK
jgi:hypothetical protein